MTHLRHTTSNSHVLAEPKQWDIALGLIMYGHSSSVRQSTGVPRNNQDLKPAENILPLPYELVMDIFEHASLEALLAARGAAKILRHVVDNVQRPEFTPSRGPAASTGRSSTFSEYLATRKRVANNLMHASPRVTVFENAYDIGAPPNFKPAHDHDGNARSASNTERFVVNNEGALFSVALDGHGDYAQQLLPPGSLPAPRYESTDELTNSGYVFKNFGSAIMDATIAGARRRLLAWDRDAGIRIWYLNGGKSPRSFPLTAANYPFYYYFFGDGGRRAGASGLSADGRFAHVERDDASVLTWELGDDGPSRPHVFQKPRNTIVQFHGLTAATLSKGHWQCFEVQLTNIQTGYVYKHTFQEGRDLSRGIQAFES